MTRASLPKHLFVELEMHTLKCLTVSFSINYTISQTVAQNHVGGSVLVLLAVLGLVHHLLNAIFKLYHNFTHTGCSQLCVWFWRSV